VKTSTSDCLLNLFSLDQIAQPEDKANAKYGISLVCPGNNPKALDSNFLNSSLGTTSIISDRITKDIMNSKPPMPQNLQIFCFNAYNSSNAKSGAISLAPLRYTDLSKFLVKDSGLKNENNMEASTTINLICNSPDYEIPYLLARLSLYSSTSLEKSPSESLLFFSISSATLNNSNTLSFSSTAPLNSDLVAGFSSSSPIISLNLSGISTFNSAILTSPNEHNRDSYLKLLNSDIFFDKIVSIKILEPQQVYDLAIEGTHNFIANDIIAHNTFVTGFVNFTNNTAFNQTLYLVNGNVGIGTTGPQNRLEVIGAATFAGGVNASSLNVTGFSITDDSLVTLADGSRKKIKDIKAGQYVLSLNEATGKLEPAKVNALLDHGVKLTYELTTKTGRAINTTGEHPYLVKLYSKEECDKYAGNVWNKGADEFNEYCTRWVEVSELNENDYIAVQKIEVEKNYFDFAPSNCISSSATSSFINPLADIFITNEPKCPSIPSTSLKSSPSVYFLVTNSFANLLKSFRASAINNPISPIVDNREYNNYLNVSKPTSRRHRDDESFKSIACCWSNYFSLRSKCLFIKCNWI